MEDISPGLLKQIRDDFTQQIERSQTIKALYEAIQSGKATYIQAEEYAYEVGSALAESFGKYLSSAVLPDGKLYFNIAQNVVRPLLEEDHSIIADAAEKVQNALNKKAGIGIKAQPVPVNDDRISGIIDKVSEADVYDDVAWVLDEPIKNFSMNVVDETLRTNVDFQGKAGLRPRIIRRTKGKCCEWCSRLAGVYDYPVEREVYRRHERCRCTVDYDPGAGKIQNAHTKQWKSVTERDRIQMRKTLGTLSPSNRRYMTDIPISKSVGAKSRNYDILDPETDDYFQFAEDTRIRNVEVFAGLGSKHPLRKEVAEGLSEQLGGKPEKWQHCKGNGIIDYNGEERPAEVHWFQEESVGRVKFKVKRWQDEG